MKILNLFLTTVLVGFSINSQAAVYPPLNLDALGGEGQVNLGWSPNSANGSISGYNIYRNTTGSLTDYQQIAVNVTGTSYVDTTVAVGGSYYYAVTTVSGSLESGFSAQDGAEPFMVHTGDVTLLNNENIDTSTKSWTISNLNSTNPTVTGASGTATGTFTSAGQLGTNDSFSITASSVITWSGTQAQAASANNSFGAYLNSLRAGKVAAYGGALGVDSTAINPNDSINTLGGTNEALVFTVNAKNLSTGSLFLTHLNLSLYNGSKTTDFVIYDPASNQVIVQYWNTNYGSTYGGIAYNSEFVLQDGYKIIVGTGASNGTNSWRVGSLVFDIVK